MRATLEHAGRLAFDEMADNARESQFLAAWEKCLDEIASDRRYKIHVLSMSCGSARNFSAIVRYCGVKYYVYFTHEWNEYYNGVPVYRRGLRQSVFNVERCD